MRKSKLTIIAVVVIAVLIISSLSAALNLKVYSASEKLVAGHVYLFPCNATNYEQDNITLLDSSGNDVVGFTFNFFTSPSGFCKQSYNGTVFLTSSVFGLGSATVLGPISLSFDVPYNDNPLILYDLGDSSSTITVDKQIPPYDLTINSNNLFYSLIELYEPVDLNYSFALNLRTTSYGAAQRYIPFFGQSYLGNVTLDFSAWQNGTVTLGSCPSSPPANCNED